MTNQTILIQSSPEQLAELIDAKIKERFEALRESFQKKNANDDLLTREEACEFLQIDPSTLWHWQNRGKVQAYGISGNRRYYKRAELMESLTPIKK